MANRRPTTLVRAAATLVAAANVATDAVACKGAAQVTFTLLAADANQLSACTIQVADATTDTWQDAAAAVGVAASGVFLGVAMNAGARKAVLTSGSSTGRRIPFNYARLNPTAGASDVTGFEVKADVDYDP